MDIFGWLLSIVALSNFRFFSHPFELFFLWCHFHWSRSSRSNQLTCGTVSPFHLLCFNRGHRAVDWIQVSRNEYGILHCWRFRRFQLLSLWLPWGHSKLLRDACLGKYLYRQYLSWFGFAKVLTQTQKYGQYRVIFLNWCLFVLTCKFPWLFWSF